MHKVTVTYKDDLTYTIRGFVMTVGGMVTCILGGLKACLVLVTPTPHPAFTVIEFLIFSGMSLLGGFILHGLATETHTTT